MIARILEPEAMDAAEEARQYDAMDHRGVNGRFVAEFLDVHGPCRGGTILDVGTGTALIPIVLCRKDPGALVLGIDLAEQMLALARRNVGEANLGDRIRLELVDAKGPPYPEATFEAVVSNTIMHHIPDPSPVLAGMARLVAPGGTLFCRDLARPISAEELDRLVEMHAGQEPEASRAMFAASLHAALTLKEIREVIAALGPEVGKVEMTSDRHWTWSWRRPA